MVLATAPRLAHATPTEPTPTTAVLPVVIEASLEVHWEQRMRDGVRRGLARGNFALVSVDAVVKATRDQPEACRTADCRAAIASSTASDYVVAGTVVQTDGGDFVLALALFDPLGVELARAETTCELCGASDVVLKLEDLAAVLRTRLDALAKDPPRLSLSTRPAGALVAVDGTESGHSPVELTLAAGRHRIDVKLQGHHPVRLSVTAVPGVVERRDVGLTPTTDPAVPRLRGAGFALLGIGLAALPPGIVLVAIDSRQYRGDCQADINGTCRRSYDTIAGGIATLVSGAVVAAAGATLLGLARRRRQSSRQRVRLRLGPDLALHFF